MVHLISKIYEMRSLNLNMFWNAILGCSEPEIAWGRFKSKLFYHVNKHIPSIIIKSEFQPPWFDSESYQACRAKERAREKFKTNKTKINELNFVHSRRLFKQLCSQKMRDNMYNTDGLNGLNGLNKIDHITESNV